MLPPPRRPRTTRCDKPEWEKNDGNKRKSIIRDSDLQGLFEGVNGSWWRSARTRFRVRSRVRWWHDGDHLDSKSDLRPHAQSAPICFRLELVHFYGMTSTCGWVLAHDILPQLRQLRHTTHWLSSPVSHSSIPSFVSAHVPAGRKERNTV